MTYRAATRGYALALADAGHSYREIERAIGISRETVRLWDRKRPVSDVCSGHLEPWVSVVELPNHTVRKTCPRGCNVTIVSS